MLIDISFEIPKMSTIQLMLSRGKIGENVEIACSMDNDIRLHKGIYLVDDLNINHIIEMNGIEIEEYDDSYSRAYKVFQEREEAGLKWISYSEIAAAYRMAKYGAVDFDTYGVCDNYQQILAHYPTLETHSQNFIVTLTPIHRKDQPSRDGWRWHKWGEYIGDHEPQHEYLYYEEGIETVYIYHIYLVKGIKK